MGNVNQLQFVQRRRSVFEGPFLEIGSRKHNDARGLRSLFPHQHYVGIDMPAGDDVDLVIDLTRPFDEIDAAFGGRRFGTICCLSILEHCDQPFVMAENMTRPPKIIDRRTNML